MYHCSYKKLSQAFITQSVHIKSNINLELPTTLKKGKTQPSSSSHDLYCRYIYEGNNKV